MKAERAALAILALMMVPLTSSAQEKETKQDQSASARVEKHTAVKVTITFAEFEGEKKVKSLPYTLVLAAREKKSDAVDSFAGFSKLRMGSRVPVYTGKENGMQYLDVGSNIDCHTSRMPDGSFDLRLSLDRSWIEGDVPVPVEKTQQASSGQFPEPIIRQFRSDLALVLRDGQSVESTFGTDPLSGKVFKVEVTLNVIK
jgi:hypothetical protein